MPNDPTPMSRPRKLRARAADSEKHATNIMLAAQHLRRESDELPGMLVNEETQRRLHAAAASLLSCSDRRRNDADFQERNRIAGQRVRATEAAMANAGVKLPEPDEATQFLIRFTNATGFRQMEWRLVGEMWQVARYMNAGSDDGHAWMQAQFHDGSTLRVEVDAEGNLEMARQVEEPTLEQAEFAGDTETIAQGFAARFGECDSHDDFVAVQADAHAESPKHFLYDHSDSSHTWDMTFRDGSRIRFGPGQDSVWMWQVVEE